MKKVQQKKAASTGLRPLKLPQHQVHTLANGLTVHLVPRGPLPLVAVRLVVRAGSAFDPVGKLGVGDFASRLFRRGAGGMTADQISETVDFVGASVGGFANEENVILSLSTPSKHFEAMFDLMSKLLLAPDFPENELELSRRRTLAALTNDLDDPGSLADRALVRATWGTHPYAHETLGGKRDIASFTRDDLRAFHRSRLGPQISHLYVVGAFDADEVMQVVERTLGGWSGGPAAPPVIPAWEGLARPGEVVIIDKPEQTQVQMRIAGHGVKRGHAEHFPLVTMNTVLGGGFTSRLVKEVRVARGLTYGIGSSFEMLSVAGTFTIASFTRTDRINELIDVTLAEVKRMKDSGPKKAELATVQRYISGLYPARLETNEAVSGAIADVVHYGLPETWVSEYRDRIMAVTVKEAAEAARHHLFGTERSLVLVGNAEALRSKVERYGRVTVWKPAELE